MVKAYSLGSEKSYPKRPDIFTWQLQVNGDSSEKKHDPFTKWAISNCSQENHKSKTKHMLAVGCWTFPLFNASDSQRLEAALQLWSFDEENWQMKIQLASVSGETKEVEIQDGLTGELTGSLVCLKWLGNKWKLHRFFRANFLCVVVWIPPILEEMIQFFEYFELMQTQKLKKMDQLMQDCIPTTLCLFSSLSS